MANKNIQHVTQRDMLEILSGAPVEAVKQETKATTATAQRKPGRPKGSKNKVKALGELFDKESLPKVKRQEEGWDFSKPAGESRQRRARSRFTPQFTISRKDAYEMLFKYLRSVKGRMALKNIILNGFVGVGELTNDDLESYIEHENLISGSKHEVVIQG
jgi:hypothetical protein